MKCTCDDNFTVAPFKHFMKLIALIPLVHVRHNAADADLFTGVAELCADNLNVNGVLSTYHK